MDVQELVMTAVRASVIYVFLLVVIRLSGKRTIGNFSAFDLLVALMLGEVVDEPIFGDTPMTQGLVAITVIAVWHYANSYLSFRSRRIDELLGGKPSVLVRDGQIEREAMAKEQVNEEELWALLRLQQIDKLEEVKAATLEPDGQLSVIKTEEAKELQKGDLQRALQQKRQGA